MNEQVKQKVKEKIKTVATERGFFEKKRNLIAICFLLCSYFGFAPAPENAENYIIVGIANTVIRNLFQLGHVLLYKETGKGVALGVMRQMTQPTGVIQSVNHKIIELENFELNVLRPEGLEG